MQLGHVRLLGRRSVMIDLHGIQHPQATIVGNISAAKPIESRNVGISTAQKFPQEARAELCSALTSPIHSTTFNKDQDNSS